MKCLKPSYFIVAIFMVIMFMAGCSTMSKFAEQWNDLSPQEKAQKTDQYLLEALADYKDEIQSKYELFKSADNQKGIDMIEDEIAPEVKKAEEAVSEYHQIVTMWREAGEKPENTDKKMENAKAVINQLERMLIKHGIEEKE